MLCLFWRDLLKNSEPKMRSCFFIIVKLEKVFDRVPREVIRFALRWKGVPEYLVNGVMSLYKGRKTDASVDGELSSSFSLKVGVHQGSGLSPFLFCIVIDALTEDVRDSSLMEFLYADDLEGKDKYGKWKNAVEGKGVMVNVDKTKGICSYYLGRNVVFQKWILERVC